MDRPDAPDIPLAADERTTLMAFLDFYRSELTDRAWGLDVDQLRQPHPPTSLSLARLIGHMAFVEACWFRERFDGDDLAPAWADIDWDADPDGEMTLAETQSVDELMAAYDAAIADSNQRIAAATSLDQLSSGATQEGERWNLRWILVHMVEEYARHCGHADLIREALDGDTAR